MDDARRPNMHNTLKLSGRYKIIAKDKDGRVFAIRYGKNLVTTTGEELVARLINPDTGVIGPDYIAFGDGTASAQKSDTQLQSEIASSRHQSVSSVVKNVMTLTWNNLTWAAGAQTFTECGIFNASVAGVMVARFLTQPLTITDGVLLDITWALTISGVD
jgi:hypothetical protein